MRTVKDSKTEMSQLILPNDTNQLNNLYGGNLMKWMDMVAAMCAMRHCKAPVVTASIDNMSFKSPIHLGEITTLHAQITRVFNTSLEVFVQVYAENAMEGTQRHCNDAYLTFVALDSSTGKPMKAPQITPETDAEKHRYERALRRRELRLVLARRLKPEDAEALASLFLQGG